MSDVAVVRAADSERDQRRAAAALAAAGLGAGRLAPSVISRACRVATKVGSAAGTVDARPTR